MVLGKLKRTTLWCLSIAAGLLYISWPLGYWLNPAATKASLASGLEAVGQPYNWLFISADVVSSLLVIAFCLILWRMFKHRHLLSTVPLVLSFVMLYGIGTILDALLPEHCVPNLEQCPSFAHSPSLLVHGVFSISASVFLFVSLCILWFARRRSLLLNALLVGYICFGFISLLEAILPGNHGNWSQHYYITLCGVWLMCIPYVVEQNELRRSEDNFTG